MTGKASGPVTVGIDIGTTSVKGLAVTGDGSVLARTHVPHRVIVDAPDRLEHDARKAWRSGPSRAFKSVSGEARDLGLEVAGVCVSSMVPSLTAVDRRGVPQIPGLLYGDVQFMLFPLPMGIKARYLVIIYALISIAMLFSEQRMYAFSQLGGALAGLLFVRTAPRHGISLMMSERWYGMRNRYYRWKRHRAARKFQVYMKKQGRTVKFDGQGRLIDEDDPNDKKRWN